MHKDIETLMSSHNIDALLVTGPGRHNPPMVYLTGGAHLTRADLIKKHGEEAVLFHTSMERDEAAKTGLKTRNLDDYGWEELLKQAQGDVLKATVARYQRMFTDMGLTAGRVALYGQMDAGASRAIFSALQAAMPGITFVDELGDTLLLKAMATKDTAEVERIHRIGLITTAVVGNVADFLCSQAVKDGVLVKRDGSFLTIGDVKKRINLWLAERGAENPEGVIFSIGHDAGVPHSTGTDQDYLRLGQTIIFDIFPCEAGGGYFYDLTRTWCLGFAPDEVLALYEDVKNVYQQLTSELRLGAPCKTYQERACELFEARGHPTIRQDPLTTQGYVHSLGHGVGLYVHELPFFRSSASEDERLEPGVVITVEPGLYYPERGMGVRLEDTIWMQLDGRPQVLAPYPHDLILPVG